MDGIDVIVVGAGAAGLAAARELVRAGRSVAVLEARDRIGGRIHTLRDPRCAAPIELGAEFIHGEAPLTFELLREMHAVAVGEGGSYWEYRDGALQSPSRDPYASLPNLLRQVDFNAPDESVDEFLKRAGRDEEARETARWMRLLVEGFDAADPSIASIQSIAREWMGSASLEQAQYRPACGYGALADELAADLPPDRSHVYLQSVVRSVEWSAGRVRAFTDRHGDRVCFDARAMIVTIPVGLLAASAIQFSPTLPREYSEAATALEMGPVTKVALRFAEPFWRSLDGGKLRDASFFVGSGTAFPTFWTRYPIESPLVVAWAGGPRAARFQNDSESEIVRCALADFAHMLSLPQAGLAEQLEAAHAHDWQRDPFAGGAYSYVRKGRSGARKAFESAIDGTLCIAGEAAAPEGLGGTVEGALRSGIAAARAILEVR